MNVCMDLREHNKRPTNKFKIEFSIISLGNLHLHHAMRLININLFESYDEKSNITFSLITFNMQVGCSKEYINDR